MAPILENDLIYTFLTVDGSIFTGKLLDADTEQGFILLELTEDSDPFNLGQTIVIFLDKTVAFSSTNDN